MLSPSCLSPLFLLHGIRAWEVGDKSEGQFLSTARWPVLPPFLFLVPWFWGFLNVQTISQGVQPVWPLLFGRQPFPIGWLTLWGSGHPLKAAAAQCRLQGFLQWAKTLVEEGRPSPFCL